MKPISICRHKDLLMDRSLLILDEDIDYCNLLVEIFTQASYTVAVGSTDWDLKAKLAELKPSIIVLDYKFGKRRGIEIVRDIHAVLPASKVMVVSCSLAEQTIRALIAEEIDGLFTKPLKPISFLKRASDLLSQIKVEATPEEAIRGKRGSFMVSGHRLSAFPGRSQASKRFAEKLNQVKAFKSRLLLVGQDGSPFKQVAEDIVEANRLDGELSEALIVFDQHNLDFSLLEAQAGQLKSEGFSGIMVAFAQAEKITDEDCVTIRQIQSEGGFLDQHSLQVRFIFCLRSELDTLYDAGDISTNVYMTLGATELKIPSLAECPEDIPLIAQKMLDDLAEARDLPVTPQLDDTARTYLREFPWANGFDELNVCVDSVLSRTADEFITQDHFPINGDKDTKAESLTPLKRYLLAERDEYVKALVELCDGDLKKAADSLGVTEESIKKLVSK